MATAAQIEANRENAKHSTGAKTQAGKQASALNNVRHGLTGHTFFFLEWELVDRFDALKEALTQEHKPETPTERILVQKMAQHHWLSQRAQTLQTLEMEEKTFDPEAQKAVAHFARYQVQHDRLFQRALHDLLKLRAEKRKTEIGFESQKQADAQEVRRESAEERKTERHEIDMEIRKTRLQREKYHAVLGAIAAADKMDGVLPQELAKIAARSTHTLNTCESSHS